MPFDPTKPAFGSPDSSAEMRAQLNGIKDLIDAVPAGPQGNPGPQGPPGVDGMPGAQGPPGMDGEVSSSALSSAIGGTSSNSDAVALLALAVSDPPTQAEMQSLANKLDELISALRR